MSLNEELYQVADEMRAIASLGLSFSSNGYDKERYERFLELSARLVAALDGQTAEVILQKYAENLSHFSPLVGVEAAVFREGKLLLIQRRDNRLWAMPGGLVEVGETLAQAALRELWEETGVHGKIHRLMAIFDSRIWKISKRYHLFAFLFHVETDESPHLHLRDIETVSSQLETLDVRFFGEDELPILSPGHGTRVPFVFRLIRGEIPMPFMD